LSITFTATLLGAYALDQKSGNTIPDAAKKLGPTKLGINMT